LFEIKGIRQVVRVPVSEQWREIESLFDKLGKRGKLVNRVRYITGFSIRRNDEEWYAHTKAILVNFWRRNMIVKTPKIVPHYKHSG